MNLNLVFQGFLFFSPCLPDHDHQKYNSLSSVGEGTLAKHGQLELRKDRSAQA